MTSSSSVLALEVFLGSSGGTGGGGHATFILSFGANCNFMG